MSGTLPNGDVVASWLNAALFQSEFRPVALATYLLEGRELKRAVRSADSTITWQTRPLALESWDTSHDRDLLGFLVSETVEELKSVLVR